MAITDWIGNFFWDSFNRIFIYVIDNVLYSLMGFLYKVFLIIGTFDLFGGFTSGTDKTMEIYQAFTKRIYSVIGIVVMFILAYQIILFVIDPDKGLKESKKLVTNIVKSIILTILAPLIFHYLSIIQYHVLVSDNLIWNIVLGEGASSSSDVIESGNTMASMLFISVFHPVGTQYSDFYNSDGTLTSPSTACSKYNDAMSSIGDDGYMSQDTLARTFRNAGLGLIIAGPIGAAVGAVYTWITDEANKTSTCDYYYWILYQGGLEKSSWQEVKPNEVSSITNYADSTAGYSNKASVLAPNSPLIDEVYQENHMEYYYFSPIGAVAVIFFLVAYTLDIATRAFKLAFLQLIAPVPILLGTIPKNEKIYTTWKDRFIKTYIDIFVRVFVMAFIALMIKLLPAFIETLMSVFKSTVGGEEAATGMLKAVTFFALVIGLLRASKEIPELFMDLVKNGGGLLSGIDLNPTKSFGKVKEAIDYQKGNAIKASKPFGAIAGAALGAKSAVNKVKTNEEAKWYDKGLAALRGVQVGGKQGFANGLQRGSMTNAMKQSNDAAGKDLQERLSRKKELGQIVEDIKTNRENGNGLIRSITSGVWESDFLNNLSQSRLGDFKGAYNGRTNGLETSFLYQAGKDYQTTSNGIIQAFDKAGKNAKADTAIWDRNAKASAKQDTNKRWTGTWAGEELYDHLDANGNKIGFDSRQKLYDAIKNKSSKYVRDAEVAALDKHFSTLGARGIQDDANSLRNVNSHYLDSLGAYPGLKAKIEKASKDIGNSTDFAEANDFLKSLNDGKDVKYDNITQVMKLMSDDKFVNKFNSLNANQQEKINKQISTYIHDVTKAQDDVSTAISNIKGGLAGTEVSFFTNRSTNNLGSKPGSDKK
ncbi:MAG: hypothetical protein K6E99_01670 [Bacilli bacterium]|nr:hypothetical protein [Bacilli bacterium]